VPLGVVEAVALGVPPALEESLGVPLLPALPLAVSVKLPREDALALGEPLGVRALLPEAARVELLVAVGSTVLLMSPRLTVGAREREALLLSVAELLAESVGVLPALALVQWLGLGL
jgi:hypothetical protein